MMPKTDLWRIKSEGDQEHPETETSPYLMGHGMDVTPVYFLPSNPINQVSIEGRHLQVYHVKQDNIRLPVEAHLAGTLRNELMIVDPISEETGHPSDRVERSVGWRLPFPQFSWVDTSVGTAKRILGYVGENIYNITNQRKPG